MARAEKKGINELRKQMAIEKWHEMQTASKNDVEINRNYLVEDKELLSQFTGTMAFNYKKSLRL